MPRFPTDPTRLTIPMQLPDDYDSIDDALKLLDRLDDQLYSARTALEEAPGPRQLESAVGDIESTQQKLQNQIDALESNIQSLTDRRTGIGNLNDAFDDSFEAIEESAETRHMLAEHLRALEDDSDPNGTVHIDGTEYEVILRELDDQDDDSEDDSEHDNE